MTDPDDRRSFELIVHERYPEIPWLAPKPKRCEKCGSELTSDNRVKRKGRHRDNGECLVCHVARGGLDLRAVGRET